MTSLKDYLSPFGRIGRGEYAWRMTAATMIWGVAFSAAYISGVPADLIKLLSVGIVILLYLWLSLAVQRARDIGYSPTIAAGCFLFCFFVLPIVAKNACLMLFAADPVCTDSALPKFGSLVIVLFFLILCSQPSNSFEKRQRQRGRAQ